MAKKATDDLAPLKRKLRAARRKRDSAEAKRAEAMTEMAEAFSEAPEGKLIELAKVAGVSRVTAWTLRKEWEAEHGK